MSLKVLRDELRLIVTDLGPGARNAVFKTAVQSLRTAVAARVNTEWYLVGEDCWIIATKEDFAAAMEATKHAFSQETSERVQARETWHGVNVSLRPSAVWAEGKTYRAEIIGCYSFEDPTLGLRWRSELSDFGKLLRYGWHHPEVRKKMSIDNASEHASQKAMRELFESHFDLRLDSV